MMKLTSNMVLKPCPFCGYMPKVDTANRKYVEVQIQPVIQVRQRVKIECERCFLTKDIVAVKLADIGTEEKALRLIAKEGAREVLEHFWNNRIEL